VKLSIAIVSYNARDDLERCLTSVLASTGLDSFEVLVADNASSDGSAAMVRERFPDVHVVELEDNVGFSRASNRLWRQARGEQIVFLNSDTLVPKTALASLAAILRESPKLGALGPKLRNAEGVLEMSYGKQLSFLHELRQKLLNWGYRNGDGFLKDYVHRQYLAERSVDWVSGACLVAPRPLIAQIEGFDENFFLYSEDVDLCARIREQGHDVRFTPRVEITHLGGRSMRKEKSLAFVEAQRSRVYFYAKHYGQPRLLLLKMYVTFTLFARFVFRPADRDACRRLASSVWGGSTPVSASRTP